MDDDWLAGEEKRAALRTVAAYRDLCRRVRRGATGGLLFGGLMLYIWYTLPDAGKFGKYQPLGLIVLGLAGLEFSAALWNKLRPAAEGVLVEGLVLAAFGAATLVRQYLYWQAGNGRPDPLFALMVPLGAYWMYRGYGLARSYFWLRKLFAVRPSPEQVRWFEGLLREVRSADPENDPDALDLPTKPPVRGRLLGDTAVFEEANGQVLIVPREAVAIEPEVALDSDRPPAAYLAVGDTDYGRFPLDPANWRNYSRWKAAGGEPVS